MRRFNTFSDAVDRDDDSDHDPGDDEQVDLGKVALVVIGFAVLYLVTAFVFSISSETVEASIRAQQIYGPIRTSRDNEVLEIVIQDNEINESWAFVEVDLLDGNKNTLLTFSGDYYHETGSDSEGYWSESKDTNDIRVTIPDPGQYYLQFHVEGGTKNAATAQDLTGNTTLKVKIKHLTGSNTLFKWMGFLLLVAGVVLNELRNQTIMGLVGRASKD